MASSPEPSPSGTPTQAPKYGTLIPNRIFVGGIAANTSEQELKQFFSAYGAVKDCKIIADRAGVSKGYGFVTFETQEDAEKIRKKEADNLIFKDRKLNIGPAIRKQAFPRMYEPSISPGSAIMYTNGVPYTYQNGMAVFNPPEGYPVPAAPQPAYPMMMSPGQPAVYMTQPGTGYASAYQSPTAAAVAAASPTHWTNAAAGQWRWAPQSPATPLSAAGQYIYPGMTTMGLGSMASMPEMMYASQTQAAAYQPDLSDASMMEAAGAPPSEGSIIMDGNTTLGTRYVDATTGVQYAATANTCTAVPPESQLQHQQALTPLPQMVHSHLATTPVMQKPVHPYGVMKRPFPTPTRKLMPTPPATPGQNCYSPRGTPPVKIMACQGQRVVTKIARDGDMSEPHYQMHHILAPLTPPSTPQGEINS